MTEHATPALFALFLWWASTGVILYLDGLPAKTFPRTLLGATALLGASLFGVVASRDDVSATGAYVAFTCGLLAWGWQQIAFYTGYLSGPRRHAYAQGCAGWQRVRHAAAATLYHEISIAAGALLLFWLSRGAPNRVGLWTFLLLWAMHVSAKLNVFLGVRNLNEEFFPDHLRYLVSFLRRRPMNRLYPVSIALSVGLAALLGHRALAAGASAFEVAGFTLLATLTILAILEHGLMMLPLPAAGLWRWGLRSRRAGPAEGVEADPTGSVGAPIRP